MDRKKVVIIDDDKSFLSELKEALNGKYDISAFSDGRSALYNIERIKPDAVVVDLKMKQVSGFQVADKLRESRQTSSIPILAVTGVFPEQEHDWAMTLCGIDARLNKPFEPVRLIEEIEKLTEEKEEVYGKDEL